MLPVIYIAGIKVAVFPLVLMLAICVCSVLCVNNRKYAIYYYGDLMKVLTYVLIGAYFSGKVLYILVSKPQSVVALFDILLSGGFVFYGGLIGGISGLYVYCKKKNLNFWEYTDIGLSILPLGQSIGRIGCYFNGCCYGKEYDGPFSVMYPIENNFVSVFPTWFVEALVMLVLFSYFQFICNCQYRGQRTGIYLVVYSVFRFIIEFYRGDIIRGNRLWFSTSQWLSFFICVIGVAIFYYHEVKNKY